MKHGHRPELIDERWAWVTATANPKPGFTYRYGPTGTVHLEGCPHMNRNTILRPFEPTDPIVRRCAHCLRRDADPQLATSRRRDEAAALTEARAADPDLTRRVLERRERRRAERGD